MPRANEPANQATEQLHLLGRVEEIEFSEKSYVAYVRAYSTASCPAGPAERSNTLWRLSPTPYWGDKDAVTRDLMDRDVYVRGLATRRETSCTPFCEMNAHAVVHAQNRFALFTDRTLSCGPPSNLQLESPETTRSATPIRYEPQQAPATAPVQSQWQSPPPQDHTLMDTSGAGFGPAQQMKLDAGTPIYLRGKIERLEFGPRSYVVFVRATSLTPPRVAGVGRGLPVQPNTALWALSPTNYFDREGIEADLTGKEIEVRGINVNGDCIPDCRIKTERLFFARSSEDPAPQSGESLVTAFAHWYDSGAPNRAIGKVERLVFHDNNRTFDLYMRSQASGGVPSRLFQVRLEYRYPRTDIERELAGKTVAATGWRAREWADSFCDPCGMFADALTVLPSDPSEASVRVTPDGPVLTTAFPARPASFPNAPLTLRVVALKRERIEISSRDTPKFVDRYFEPGEEYFMSVGNDWTVSTPDGAAFEWRAGDTSLGLLANAGPVKAQRIDDVAPSSELYTALAQRADLRTRYSENHPEVQKANELVRELLQRRKASLAR
jgi:hypothetical protein